MEQSCPLAHTTRLQIGLRIGHVGILIDVPHAEIGVAGVGGVGGAAESFGGVGVVRRRGEIEIVICGRDRRATGLEDS